MTSYENTFERSPLQTFLEMICVIDHTSIDSEDYWKASVILTHLFHTKEGFEELLRVNVDYIALLFPSIDGIKQHIINGNEQFTENARELNSIAKIFAQELPSGGANTLLSDGLKRIAGLPSNIFSKKAKELTEYLPLEKHHRENHGLIIK